MADVTYTRPPVPAGYQQVSAGPNTVGTLTIPTDSRYAIIKVVSAAGNYRDDGTSPASASGGGYPLAVGDIITLMSAEQLVAFEFICTGDDETVLEVLYYKISV